MQGVLSPCKNEKRTTLTHYKQKKTTYLYVCVCVCVFIYICLQMHNLYTLAILGSGRANSYKEKSIYLITSTILENDKLKYVVLKVKHWL